MGNPKIDLTGKRFGRLTVIREAEPRKRKERYGFSVEDAINIPVRHGWKTPSRDNVV